MARKKGRIIVVVGAPSSGKSTLIRNLKNHYKIEIFLEGEEKDFPHYIKESIKNIRDGLKTIIFFHNLSISQYIEAINLKNKGKTVLLDNFWFSNLLYLNVILRDRNDCDLIKNLIGLTNKILPLPDVIIYLEATGRLIKNRIRERKRIFERNFLTQADKINKNHIIYFRRTNNFKKDFPRSILMKFSANKLNFHFVAAKLVLIKKNNAK